MILFQRKILLPIKRKFIVNEAEKEILLLVFNPAHCIDLASDASFGQQVIFLLLKIKNEAICYITTYISHPMQFTARWPKLLIRLRCYNPALHMKK